MNTSGQQLTLDLAGVRLFLSYDVRWVYCPTCGRTVEQVPWSSTIDSRYTDVFEEHVAYMAQRTDKTAVRRTSLNTALG